MEKCELCGTTEDLVVHHRDGVHGVLIPDDTMILCRRCHNKIHRLRELGLLPRELEEKCFINSEALNRIFRDILKKGGR